MIRIHQLSPHEAHKIAAGEVVERPANVVKELVENSIDAHATQITIMLEDAGKKLIRIIDNGHGMGAEDARICFNHHATSKIKSVDDLTLLATFGFRGEALTSIAAVSHVTLITKESDASHGTQLILEQGTIIEESLASGNAGTDIAIRDLFFNVPARQKFLKKKETELHAIQQLFNAFCLDYQTIHFKLIHDQRTLSNCPPAASLNERIAQLWDTHFTRHMLPLSAENESYKVSINGMISGQNYFRYDRSNIFFFVNNRWIKNQALSKALIKGYNNVLPPGRFPAGCIFITLDTQSVDINIHPRKEEVQFLHPSIVEQLIQKTVAQLLGQQTQERIAPALMPHVAQPAQQDFLFHKFPEPFVPTSSALTFGKVTSSFDGQIGTQNVSQNKDLESPFPVSPALPAIAGGDGWELGLSKHEMRAESRVEGSTLSVSQQAINKESHLTIIGQWSKTYILIEQPDGLLLVDQHAAHERVLYELFSTRFADVATVQLLFPHIITLNQDDLKHLEPYLFLFHENGIRIEQFGNNQLMVTATPVHIKDQSVDDLIKEVIGWIHEYQKTDSASLFETLHKKLRAQMACKAAVKAGDILTIETMQQLLTDLYKTENRSTCPHGRPTTFLLHTHDIERKFKRRI